jgi:Resolvase, N terminal domain
VAFVSLGEGIDCTTPAGKLQLHILAVLSEFERGRIRELTVPLMALGLLLLPFRATRGSGIVLSAYTGAYLFGLLVGAALFWFGRDV